MKKNDSPKKVISDQNNDHLAFLSNLGKMPKLMEAKN